MSNSVSRPDQAFAVPASAFIKAYQRHQIDWVVTVPDFVQLSIHSRLAKGDTGLSVLTCANENQAVQAAAGLYIGGKRSVVMIQNQGLYNCMNAVRAIGLDAHIPLVFAIGQFGREFSNLGADPRLSKRRMVSLLEPVLDTMDIPYFQLEHPRDVDAIDKAIETAYSRQHPAALLIGHYTSWE